MEVRSTRRRACALAFTTLIGSVPWTGASAALLARFDFEDPSGAFSLAPEDVATGLQVDAWEDTDGTLRSVSRTPGFAMSARSFHDGNTLRLTLTPAAGFALTLDTLEFMQSATATGPATWEMKAGDAVLATGATTSTYTSSLIALELPDRTGPVELLLAATGASSSLGTWRLDDFTLHGRVAAISAVPAPAAGWLFGAGLFALARRRRRAGPG
ncbi:MAG: PEP-CTERM sorting domain-containing protein [Gammaproteobacteria bacterium]